MPDLMAAAAVRVEEEAAVLRVEAAAVLRAEALRHREHLRLHVHSQRRECLPHRELSGHRARLAADRDRLLLREHLPVQGPFLRHERA
jgi:hypothetical protein